MEFMEEWATLLARWDKQGFNKGIMGKQEMDRMRWRDANRNRETGRNVSH